MGNVKSIESAVESLPPMELAEFRRWFAEFDGNAWDRQIEQDATSGKLDQLAVEALADFSAGSARRGNFESDTHRIKAVLAVP